jgi:hypothetical protein
MEDKGYSNYIYIQPSVPPEFTNRELYQNLLLQIIIFIEYTIYKIGIARENKIFIVIIHIKVIITSILPSILAGRTLVRFGGVVSTATSMWASVFRKAKM